MDPNGPTDMTVSVMVPCVALWGLDWPEGDVTRVTLRPWSKPGRPFTPYTNVPRYDGEWRVSVENNDDAIRVRDFTNAAEAAEVFAHLLAVAPITYALLDNLQFTWD